MPFEYINEHVVDSKLIEPKKEQSTPIFLIPGIHGDGSDFANFPSLFAKSNFGQQLKNPRNSLPLYIWHDPRHPELNQNTSNTIKPYTLEELAKLISDEILTINPKGPYLVAGFSFGGLLSALVNQQLSKKGKEVHTFLIDTPSPDLAKEYLEFPAKAKTLAKSIKDEKYAGEKLVVINNKRIAITKKLISIFNHAALKSNLSPVSYDNSKLAIISKKTTGEQIDKIFLDLHNQVVQLGKKMSFEILHQTAKYNLEAILDFPVHTLEKLKNLCVLTTKETRLEYGCTSTAGWERFTENQHLTTYPLQADFLTHLSILKENFAHYSTHRIKEFFSNQLFGKKDELSIMVKSPLEFKAHKEDGAVDLSPLSLSSICSMSSTPSTSPSRSPFTSPGLSPDVSPRSLEKAAIKTPAGTTSRSLSDSKDQKALVSTFSLFHQLQAPALAAGVNCEKPNNKL